MKKPKAFPKTLYVYEEADSNGRNTYFVLCEVAQDRVGDGLMGVYELKSTVQVTHTVEVVEVAP